MLFLKLRWNWQTIACRLVNGGAHVVWGMESCSGWSSRRHRKILAPPLIFLTVLLPIFFLFVSFFYLMLSRQSRTLQRYTRPSVFFLPLCNSATNLHTRTQALCTRKVWTVTTMYCNLCVFLLLWDGIGKSELVLL